MVVESYEVVQGEFVVSTDRKRIDIDAVYHYLHDEAYWSQGIPREIVERSIENSLCFGIYRDGEQVGFARMITDYATFAYLADVFVLAPYRGQGLSKWMMECIMAHPGLQGIRRFHLLTRDAHGLYEKSGFVPVAEPGRHMEKYVPVDQGGVHV